MTLRSAAGQSARPSRKSFLAGLHRQGQSFVSLFGDAFGLRLSELRLNLQHVLDGTRARELLSHVEGGGNVGVGVLNYAVAQFMRESLMFSECRGRSLADRIHILGGLLVRRSHLIEICLNHLGNLSRHFHIHSIQNLVKIGSKLIHGGPPKLARANCACVFGLDLQAFC